MQPDRRRSPVARLAFRHRFRAVRGSLPRLGTSWRLAAVLFFLIAVPVFAQGDDPPAAPDIRRTFAGDRIVTLIWARADDPRITVYQIRYGPNGAWDPDWTDIEGTGNGTTGHAPRGLTNGVKYTFEVRAVAGDVEGLSASVMAVPVPGAPAWEGEPAVGNGAVTLTWADPEDDAVTAYQHRHTVSRGTDQPDWMGVSWITIADAGVRDLTVPGLTNGIEYTFEVRAVAGDYPGKTASVTATLPLPAPDIQRTFAGDRIVTLIWARADDPRITVYQIRYGPNGAWDPDWTDIEGTGNGTTGHAPRGLTNGVKYTFEVRAVAGDVEGLSASVMAVPVPGAPVWAGAPVVGDGAVTLTWADPGDDAITGYQVRYEESGTDLPDWSADHDIESDAITTTHPVTGLTNGIEYTIEVRAVAGAYPGVSASVRVWMPPAAPGNLTALPGDRAATLTWDNSDAPAVTGYEIRYGVGEVSAEWTVIPVRPESGAVTTTQPVPGLTNGIEYRFEVRAIRGSVQSLPASVTATPDLPPPRNLNAALVNGAVTLTWEAPATAAAPITGYQVLWRRPDVDAAGVSHPIGAAGATETTYVDAVVEGGHSYVYRVKTQRDSYLSGSSNAARIDVPPPPPPPGNLTAREDDGQVTLTWTDPGDNTLTGYQVRYVERGTDLPAWSGDHDIDSGAGTTTHPVTGLMNGIEYRFEVRAVRGSVQGLPASVTATPGNRPPANLEATIDNGTVVLTWEAPTADLESVSSYHFHYSLSSDGVNVRRSGTFGTPDADTRTVDTIASERGYPYIAYKVRAKRGEEFSDWSNTVTVMFHAGPPPPEGLNASAGVGQVTLTWDDAENDAITGYQVRYAQRDAALPAWSDRHNITSTASTTTHEVTGLTDGTAYTFEVRAIAGDDEGASSSVTATPVPAKPANFRAASGNRKVTLTWSDPNDDAVIGYQYHYYSGDAPAQIAWRDTAVTTSHAVTGLTNGTEYTFEVRAKAGIVHGDSARAKATPGPTVTPPPTPCQTLSINEISNVTVNVNESFSRTARATGGCDAIRITVTGQPTGVTIESVNDRTKRIRSTGLSAPGTHTVTVEADDAEQNMATRTFTITVCDRIDIDSIGDFSVQEGTEFDRTVPVSGGCGTRTSERELGPTWVEHEIDTNSNLRIHGTAPSTPGTHDVRVRVQAEGGNSDTEPFTITVTREEPDCEIEIAEIDDVTVTEGDSFSRTASATANCPPITYTKLGAWPSWVTLDANSGRIGGTAPSSAAGTNPTVTVRASDSDDVPNTDDESFTITVVCAPFVIRKIQNMQVTPRTEIGLTASVIPACPTAEFSISGQPTGVGIVSDTGFIHGDVGPSVETYDVTVTATDSKNTTTTDEEKFVIRVIDPCESFALGEIDDVTATVCQPITAIQASASGGTPPYMYSLSTKPASGSGLSIGEESGEIIGTPTATGSFDVTVSVQDFPRLCTAERSFRLDVGCPAISVGGLPASVTATVNEEIDPIQATSSGGCGTMSYSIMDKPSWIRIHRSSGEITGAPTETGEFNVKVKATDGKGCAGMGSFPITVEPAFTVSCPSNQDVTQGSSISGIHATASGGRPPYAFSPLSVSPSPGLALSISSSGPDGSNGSITGTANVVDTYTVTVTARDNVNKPASCNFTITVTCPPRSLSSIADVAASRNEAISPIQVRVSGGCPPYTYRLSSNASTAGLSVSTSGQISGTPGAIGSWQITVSVTDARSNTSTTSFWIRVAEPIIIGPIADMYGEYLASFSDGPVEVFGGVPPYEYSLTGQPSGLDVNDAGVIEGTPSESGDFAVTLTVRDQQGRSESSLFFIIISTGDFNGDGRADATDSKLFNERMGLRRSDSGFDRRMDMNGDGIINWADFVILGRHIERDASSGGGSGSGGSGDTGN